MTTRNARIVGVLLSGGEGKRLWPLSTRFHPKQFLKLGNENALLVDSIKRNDPVVDRFIAVANKRYLYLIQRDFAISTGKPFKAIFEYDGKNTAPAIAFALMASEPDDILVVAPTDATIKGLERYYDAMDQAISFAEDGFIATFGIQPTSPQTGFGYIHHVGNDIIDFTEKPTYDKAQEYLASGDYLWNSGIFVFRASVMAEELRRYRSDIYEACEQALSRAECAHNCKNHDDEHDDLVITERDTALIPSESIDYAVIEKSQRLKVVLGDFYWNDLGSIEALATQFEPDERGNRVSGDNVVLSDCQSTSIINDGANNLVVANGLEDVVVANTNNVVYISRKGKSQEIKDIVNVKIEDLHEFVEENLWSERPWGFYEVLLNTPHYKIKRLTIEPGMRLSFQAHQNRTEYWVAVVGGGTVTLGTEELAITTPQCVEIPSGTAHRIANTTDDTLRIIEVSTGNAISESDIVRFSDDFGRE